VYKMRAMREALILAITHCRNPESVGCLRVRRLTGAFSLLSSSSSCIPCSADTGTLSLGIRLKQGQGCVLPRLHLSCVRLRQARPARCRPLWCSYPQRHGMPAPPPGIYLAQHNPNLSILIVINQNDLPVLYAG
jgi:hypothetical protein